MINLTFNTNKWIINDINSRVSVISYLVGQIVSTPTDDYEVYNTKQECIDRLIELGYDPNNFFPNID